MREIHDFLFEEATEGMTAEEVLNYYRNLYHAEPQSTEHGIVAKALNDILPRMILPPCKVGDIVYFPMETNGECEPYIDVGQVFNIAIDKRLTMWISVRYESGLKYYHTSDDFGKTVFLASEEAEQALTGEHHAEIH